MTFRCTIPKIQVDFAVEGWRAFAVAGTPRKRQGLHRSVQSSAFTTSSYHFLILVMLLTERWPRHRRDRCALVSGSIGLPSSVLCPSPLPYSSSICNHVLPMSLTRLLCPQRPRFESLSQSIIIRLLSPACVHNSAQGQRHPPKYSHPKCSQTRINTRVQSLSAAPRQRVSVPALLAALCSA